MKKYIVITTVNPKTKAVSLFEKMTDWHTVVVADTKSDHIESSESLTYLSVVDQLKLGYDFVDVCPYNDYVRKNIGFLYAIQNGADVIYEADDDNVPYDNWYMPDFTCHRKIVSYFQFVNIYNYFTDEPIWPRGYPLDDIQKRSIVGVEPISMAKIGVWQGMADDEPDVDAIYRLTVNKKVKFEDKESVVLERGYYCPFNSQSTFWTKEAFPYLYLPATPGTRFGDILRSYITQRLLWEQNLHLGFMKATVYHERNEHDLISDFKYEIEGYLYTKPIVNLLDSLTLTSDPIKNLMTVYYALIENDFVSGEEIRILRAWINEFQKISN